MTRTRKNIPALWLTALMLALVRGYQWLVSPWLGVRCRFEPSCSNYARTAISRHGPSRGLLLTVKRLLKCHPWGPTGYDPVPDEPTEADP